MESKSPQQPDFTFRGKVGLGARNEVLSANTSTGSVNEQTTLEMFLLLAKED